jgi:hypothetical protein
MIYNLDEKKPYFYNGTLNTWMPISSDTSQWIFKPAENKLYFKPALAANDSIYYDKTKNQFVFADEITYTNSMGLTFPVTDFGGKYIFKTQASRSYPLNLSGEVHSALTLVNEVDSISADSNSYYGLFMATVTNPKNNVYNSELIGINNGTIHAGQDTLESLIGISNRTTARGNGFIDQIYGVNNSIILGGNRSANVSEIFGNINAISASTNPSPYTVGDMYGNFTNFNTAIVNRTTGNVYGNYIGNVSGPLQSASRQYAIYTNTGNNRFGDSTVISSTVNVPRAILDVNSTESMIMPTGTTIQRPTSTIEGQQRYNSQTKSVETFNGFEWIGVLSFNTSINIPTLAAHTGATVNTTILGAKFGDVIVVTPKSALNDGYAIAWANVSAFDTVAVHFSNYSAAPLIGYSDTFYIKIIR